MTEFIVGKKYTSSVSGIIYTCLFVNEDGVLLQRNRATPNFWSIADADRSLSPYVPPPKKVKKTGWTIMYKDSYGNITCGPYFETKNTVDTCFRTSFSRNKFAIAEITWEEEVPGDDDADVV